MDMDGNKAGGKKFLVPLNSRSGRCKDDILNRRRREGRTFSLLVRKKVVLGVVILASQRVREQAGKERLTRIRTLLKTFHKCGVAVSIQFKLLFDFFFFHWSALFLCVLNHLVRGRKKILKPSHVFKNKINFKSHFIRFCNTNFDLLKEKYLHFCSAKGIIKQ